MVGSQARANLRLDFGDATTDAEALAWPAVSRIVASTGFITSSGTTERKAEPRFDERAYA